MSEPIWNRFLTERDKQMWALSGYGARQGFGKRPAVLVIDVNYNFCGDRREPILQSIKRWRNSCGEEAWDAIEAIKRLLLASRSKGLPIIYTTGVRRADNWDWGSWTWKNSRSSEHAATRSSATPEDTIIPDVAPHSTDILVLKQKPSAFFGTPLASYLTLLGADSVIVTGTTTGGCVRATVIDAFSHNYRVAVVEEGCFDRSQASHAVNLCDMDAKYADVRKLDEVLTFIGTLNPGMFDLPKGHPQNEAKAATR
jgi:nicotinamidase-related amidase